LEIATGEYPFKDLTGDGQLFMAILKNQKPASDRTRYPKLEATSPLWSLLDSCWEADPEDRPKMADAEKKLLAMQGDF